MTTLIEDQPVERLTAEECWELLGSETFGRLAYRLVDEVHLVPINYAADAGRLLFRSGAGSKLLAAALQTDVAFEIDRHGADEAWSVVVRGHLRRLPEDEADLWEDSVDSWAPIRKDEVLELGVEAVSGRRFRLHPDTSPGGAR